MSSPLVERLRRLNRVWGQTLDQAAATVSQRIQARDKPEPGDLIHVALEGRVTYAGGDMIGVRTAAGDTHLIILNDPGATVRVLEKGPAA